MAKMTQFAVYQLPFENPKIRDLSFLKPTEVEAISDEFELVARVDARSLDEVFRIGNFVCKEDKTLIQVLGKMHSISVGDIIHNLTTDETFVVARFGFEKINMMEAA
jgi:hypothetical protein